MNMADASTGEVLWQDNDWYAEARRCEALPRTYLAFACPPLVRRALNAHTPSSAGGRGDLLTERDSERRFRRSALRRAPSPPCAVRRSPHACVDSSQVR